MTPADLEALAAAWTADAAEHAARSRHYQDTEQHLLAGVARGRARQLEDCATAITRLAAEWRDRP